MLTREDIEGFLDRLTAEGASYDEVEQGLWVVRPGGNLELDVVVHYSPPVVLLRVKVMNVPQDDGRCADLNRRLLELNANDLVHDAQIVPLRVDEVGTCQHGGSRGLVGGVALSRR